MKKNKGISVILLILALVIALGASCVTTLQATEAKKENGLILGLDLSGGVSITYKIVNENPSATDIADTIAKMEDQTEEGFATVTNPKFEMYVDKAGEFRFRLKARNGEIIATSEGYKAKASCENGIESVRKNAPEAEVVEE